MRAMGSHQSAGKGQNVWLSPPDLVEALGPFDLDPCYSEPRPWDTARTHFGKDAAQGMGGLFEDWFGLVWCNPPYGLEAQKWLRKCADHGNAIALIFARTETEAFHRQVWEKADALFFFEKRLTFMKPCGAKGETNAGAPSVLVCYGSEAVDRVTKAGLLGKMIELKGLKP